MNITNTKWLSHAVCGLVLGSIGLAGALFSTSSQALPVPPAGGYEIITYYNQANQVVAQQTIPSAPCQGQVSVPNWGTRTTRLTWQTFQCPNTDQGPYRLRH